MHLQPHSARANATRKPFLSERACTCKESPLRLLLCSFLPVFRNAGGPLKALLQVMWAKMCCVCAIFPRNKLGCRYLHAWQTQGSGLNYLPLCIPSLSPLKISFEGVLASLRCLLSSVSTTEGQLAPQFNEPSEQLRVQLEKFARNTTGED